jgi:hypothetical protein
VAVLTLAPGIRAIQAIFSVFNAILPMKLPVEVPMASDPKLLP